jgi:mRNA-degrading endonuclease RelE of RelBE toxin-antitoxin system
VIRLEKASTDPDRFFAKLVGSDDFKLRVGDYRLLALLSHSEKTIIVERVDHRSRIYKR